MSVSRRRFLAASAALAAAPRLRAAQVPSDVAFVSGSLEYKSDESLGAFQLALAKSHPIRPVPMYRKTDTDIPGLEQLARCDAAVFFTRRLSPPPEQLKLIQAYVASGKPVVGVRTASHGFQNWLAMDAEVFGGSYANHTKQGVPAKITVSPGGEGHPLLKGVQPFTTTGGLYRNAKLAADCVELLRGDNGKDAFSVAWVRERPVGGKRQKVFYTSLGTPDDFRDANFARMLTNAVLWAVGTL